MPSVVTHETHNAYWVRATALIQVLKWIASEMQVLVVSWLLMLVFKGTQSTGKIHCFDMVLHHGQ